MKTHPKNAHTKTLQDCCKEIQRRKMGQGYHNKKTKNQKRITPYHCMFCTIFFSSFNHKIWCKTCNDMELSSFDSWFSCCDILGPFSFFVSPCSNLEGF